MELKKNESMLTKTFFDKKYDVIEEIGRGSYGTVYRIERKTDRACFALKITKSIAFTNGKEIEMLKQFNHPHIIEMHEYRCGKIAQNNFKFDRCEIVLDYFEMDLERFMCRRLTVSQIGQIMLQLFDAVNYLHGLDVAHRDLKPKNILISADNLRVKICDFGMAAKPLRFQQNVLDVQTLNYRAPEILIGWSRYTKAIDLWSLGCIFVELFFSDSRRLFPGKDDLEQLKAIISLCGSFSVWFFVRLQETERVECIRILKCCGVKDPNNLMEHGIRNDGRAEKLRCFLQSFISELDLIDLIVGLLTVTPTKRLTAFQGFNHKYFKQNFNK